MPSTCRPDAVGWMGLPQVGDGHQIYMRSINFNLTPSPLMFPSELHTVPHIPALLELCIYKNFIAL